MRTTTMANNDNAMQKSPVQAMNAALGSEAIKARLSEVLQDKAPAFAASVLEVFGADNYLQKCNPHDVIRECMKAATLNLPLSKALGFAWVVPFSDHGTPKPQFQIGWKGYVQLAQRTGQYRFINAGPVYEGELRKVSKLTGEVDIEGEATSEKIIGFFAHIELVNGYRKSLYWKAEKMQAHAIRYNQQCKKAGKLAGVWTSDFEAMGTKTVLATLIRKYGIMSTEMQSAERDDQDAEDRAGAEIQLHAGTQPLGFDGPVVNAETEPDSADEVDKETGEVKIHKGAGDMTEPPPEFYGDRPPFE